MQKMQGQFQLRYFLSYNFDNMHNFIDFLFIFFLLQFSVSFSIISFFFASNIIFLLYTIMGNKAAAAAKPEVSKVDQQQNRMQLLDGLIKKSISISSKPYFGQEKELYKGMKPSTIDQIIREQPVLSEERQPHSSKDKRIKVTTYNYPYSAIGQVTFRDGSVIRRGTGFLIGKNLVLTAAHNLYDNEKKKRMKSVIFNLNIDENVCKGFQAKRTFYPDQFIANIDNTNKYDYGIIQLGQDFQDSHGYFGLDFRESERLQVEIAGYPEKIYSKNIKERVVSEMFKDEGEFTKVADQPGRISYSISTSRGQSGSPIFWSSGQNFYAVGIHTTEGEGNCNQGILFTKQMKERIDDWAGDNKKTLNLQNMDVTSLELEALLEKYKYIVSKLNTVSLQGNIIGSQGTKYLAGLNFRNLLSLSLWRNKIGPLGAKYLAQGKFQSLTTLNLEQNEIGPQGAKYLAEGNFESLLTLNLQWNNIGPEGAQYLAQGKLNQLTTLYLSYNKIQYLGAIFLAHSKLFNLSKIDLQWNNIEDEKKNEIRVKFSEGRIADFKVLL